MQFFNAKLLFYQWGLLYDFQLNNLHNNFIKTAVNSNPTTYTAYIIPTVSTLEILYCVYKKNNLMEITFFGR